MSLAPVCQITRPGHPDVRPKDVKALLNKVAASGPVQANRVRALLAAIFRYGVDEFIIEVNPVRDVRTPTKEAARERALDTPGQLRGLFATLDAMQSALPIKIALPLILATAARPGEVCGMRWSHVGLQGATWTLPEELDKSGKGRTIPLSALALGLLEQAKAFTLVDRPDVVFPAVRRGSIEDAHLNRALCKHRKLFADNGVAPTPPASRSRALWPQPTG